MQVIPPSIALDVEDRGARPGVDPLTHNLQPSRRSERGTGAHRDRVRPPGSASYEQTDLQAIPLTLLDCARHHLAAPTRIEPKDVTKRWLYSSKPVSASAQRGRIFRASPLNGYRNMSQGRTTRALIAASIQSASRGTSGRRPHSLPALAPLRNSVPWLAAVHRPRRCPTRASIERSSEKSLRCAERLRSARFPPGSGRS